VGVGGGGGGGCVNAEIAMYRMQIYLHNHHS